MQINRYLSSSSSIINSMKLFKVPLSLNYAWRYSKFSTVTPHIRSLDDKFQFHQYFGMANKQIKNDNFIEALENYRKALEILERTNKDQDQACIPHETLAMAEIYLRKGTIFYSSKNPKDAMRSFKKAKELYKDHPGHEKIIAECAENIASIYLDEGIYKESLKNFEESLVFYQQSSDDIACAKIFYKMSLVYVALEDREITLDKLNSSFKILVSSNIVANEEVSDLYYAIGQAFLDNQEHQKAIDALNWVLKIKTDIFGENHLDLVNCYSTLGDAYNTLMMNSEALKILLKSLELKKKVYSKNDMELIQTYVDIADLYFKEDNFEKALQNYKFALKYSTKKKLKVIVYPYIYYKIGAVYLDMNDISEAIKSFKKAIETYSESKNGNRTVNLSELYEIIGLSYCMLQNYAEARDYYNQALKLSTHSIRVTHKDTFHLNLTLGSINSELNNFEDAIKHYQEAQNEMQIEQNEHPTLGYIHHGFANVYYKQTLIKQAIHYYKSAVELLKRELGPSNVYFANLYRDFAFALREMGEHTEAMENFNKGMEIMMNHYGIGHSDTLKFANELKKLYEKTEDFEQLYKLEKFFNLKV